MDTDTIEHNDTTLPAIAERADQAIEGLPRGDELSALLGRALSALTKGVLAAGGDITKALSDLARLDDTHLLARLAEEALSQDPLVDTRTKLLLRGTRLFNQQLAEAGGTLSPAEMADRLGITPDGVRKRRTKGQLLAVARGRHHSYPVWQVTEEGSVLPGFGEILKLLDTESDVAKIRFFLAYDSDLDESPLQALREGRDLEMIRRKARQFGVQGAR